MRPTGWYDDAREDADEADWERAEREADAEDYADRAEARESFL